MYQEKRSFCLLVLGGSLVLISGCASKPSSFSVSQRSGSGVKDIQTDIVLDDRQIESLERTAKKQLGIKYKYGGNTPSEGFDCSGFIRFVFNESANINLPRTVEDMSLLGKRISVEKAKTGDIIFFGSQGKAFHAGISLGNGRFIHAPSSGGRVRIESMNSAYWKKNLLTTRSFR